MRPTPTASPAGGPAPTPSRRASLLADGAIAVALLALAGYWAARLPPLSGVPSRLGRDFVLYSRDICLLLAAAALAIASARGFDAARLAFARAPRLARAFALAVPCALALYLCIDRIQETKTALLPQAGGRYYWLDDDAMISLRYARNLAQGAGLAWNPGQPRVEGYTNFLWTLVMAVPHLLGLPPRLAPGFVLGLNLAILPLILLWACRLAERMGLSPASRWIALLLIASNRWIVYWTVAGSEAPALALALLAAIDLCLRARPERPLAAGAGIALGLMALLRADAPILLLALLPTLAALWRARRARVRAFALAFAIPFAHALWRRAYYGQWLPNTYHLKAVDLPMKEAMGIFYATFLLYSPGIFVGAALLQLASLRLLRRPVARLASLVPWAAILYAALIGGDELPELRFLVPVLPLMILGAVYAAEAIFVSRRAIAPASRFTRLPGAWGWAVAALAAAFYPSLLLPTALDRLGADRGRIERRNVEIGLLLRRNAQPGATVAHFWAGAAPYFSALPAQDMLGKSDAHIARLPGHPGQWPPGHTKYDPAYSMSLAPDIVVTALPADRLDPQARKKDPDAEVYPALYALYDDPTFQSLYAPGLVPLPASAGFHAVFVRKNSRFALPPEEWKN